MSKRSKSEIFDNWKFFNHLSPLTSQMKTSMILNDAFRGNTEAKSVKNHDEAYMAVWNPWCQRKYWRHKIVSLNYNCLCFLFVCLFVFFFSKNRYLALSKIIVVHEANNMETSWTIWTICQAKREKLSGGSLTF